MTYLNLFLELFPWEKSNFEMRSAGTSMMEEMSTREGGSRGDRHGVAAESPASPSSII
jgi:hypothetical protein